MNNCIYVAELGINGNGSLTTYKQLIDLAKKHGFDYVKFQKRDLDSCYTQEYLDSPRESPWGKTQRDQKKGLELSIDDYKEIDTYCKKKDIGWYYSAWDIKSAKEMAETFDTDFIKIAKASITNKDLAMYYQNERNANNLIVSVNPYNTTDVQIMKDYWDYIVDDDSQQDSLQYILSCVSLYPAPDNFTGVHGVTKLINYYRDYCIGYSNHSPDWVYPVIASYLGAEMIEVHITLDKNMYGSDQKASLDDSDLTNMMKYRYNPPNKDEVNRYMEQEAEVLKKLRQIW